MPIYARSAIALLAALAIAGFSGDFGDRSSSPSATHQIPLETSVGVSGSGSLTAIATVTAAVLSAVIAQQIAWHAIASNTRLTRNLSGKNSAYVALGNLLVRMRAAVAHPAPEYTLEHLDGVDTDGEWWKIQARIEVYGSPDVRRQFDKVLQQRVRVLSSVETWLQVRDIPGAPPPDVSDSLTKLREDKETSREAVQILLELMNHELKDA